MFLSLSSTPPPPTARYAALKNAMSEAVLRILYGRSTHALKKQIMAPTFCAVQGTEHSRQLSAATSFSTHFNIFLVRCLSELDVKVCLHL